jgi:hypothetical protein
MNLTYTLDSFTTESSREWVSFKYKDIFGGDDIQVLTPCLIDGCGGEYTYISTKLYYQYRTFQ